MMRLTREQEALAAGREGIALGLAMKTLIAYGEAFGAQRMVPIKSAHVAVSFGIGFISAMYRILERLTAEGVKVRVPTSVNPRPGRELGLKNKFAFMHQKKLEQMLDALGVMPNYSCVCYEDVNVPGLGDRLCWSESSAVQYANSVLGARTNRNSLLIDLCGAVTGYAPEFGYMLDENRRGRMLVRLNIDKMDASALGFVLGKRVVDKVPVLEHYDFSKSELKNMGGAMAASGGIAMFHVEGLTPEAPDIKTASGGSPETEITITQGDIDALCNKGEADMVVMGCPQMSFEEAIALAPYFIGKRITVPTWFCMVPSAQQRFASSPLCAELLASGVVVQTCCPVAALSIGQGMGKKRILTSSGKCFYYLEGTQYGNIDDCLRVCGVLS